MKNFSKLSKTLIILAFASAVTACSGNSDESSNQQQDQSGVIPSVEAVQARYGSLPLVERFSGNVRSENQVSLYPEISGVVQEVYVQNGDFVEQGDPIVKLNTGILEKQLQQAEANLKISNAQLKQAKAQFNEIQSEYNRVKQLEAKDLTSQAEVDQIEGQLLSAEADVELAEAQRDQSASIVEQRREELSKAIIKAPISGTVGQRNAEIGMQANTSTQLFLIGDLTRLKVEIVLTEDMLSQINVGQTARVIVENRDGEQTALEAEISRISPFLNEVTRSTQAEIDVNNESGLLRPGMFVPVDILFGESEQATLIPISALFTNTQTGESGVYLASSLGSEIEPVSDSSANGSNRPAAMSAPTPVEFVPIDVIAQGRMELGVAGIESGQWVVTMGQDLLAEGREQARVRSMSWERIYQLQNLQREDLLEQIMQERDRSANNMNL
ncbi:efflux RND transporter periplasmic adaptor subunit [Gracilimonas amylolytica]|uniref:efflux RND transporter periplasmic adaptor subunit n=1 Tax=Gracilimonas amylolytica TaxID=1749045 RepID=UPI000CD8C5DD|nr:efflux RND transporter periplasmic adaptor subunit [Gracilimonas amylolytica]